MAKGKRERPPPGSPKKSSAYLASVAATAAAAAAGNASNCESDDGDIDYFFMNGFYVSNAAWHYSVVLCYFPFLFVCVLKCLY
jgi:hypothetical protein